MQYISKYATKSHFVTAIFHNCIPRQGPSGKMLLKLLKKKVEFVEM